MAQITIATLMFFYRILFCLIFVSVSSNALLSSDEFPAAKMERKLNELGPLGFLMEIERNHWKAPMIYSNWHVLNKSDEKSRESDIASRNFGKALAVHLKDYSLEIRRMEPEKKLYQKVVALCDLSDWSAKTEGYGNILLAQRCLDLAAVGLARLIANPSFDIEKCSAIEKRFHPHWFDIQTRIRILNLDIDAQVFLKEDKNHAEKVWVSGKRLLLEKRHPDLKEQRLKNPAFKLPYESDAIMLNLTYFEEPSANQLQSVTLVDIWDLHWAAAFAVAGLELQNVDKAMALLEFRRNVGFFPTKPKFSEEELKEHEQAVAEHKKWNIKISSDERPPERVAFDLFWKRALKAKYKDQATIPNSIYNLDALAWETFDEIRRGVLLDKDNQ